MEITIDVNGDDGDATGTDSKDTDNITYYAVYTEQTNNDGSTTGSWVIYNYKEKDTSSSSNAVTIGGYVYSNSSEKTSVNGYITVTNPDDCEVLGTGTDDDNNTTYNCNLEIDFTFTYSSDEEGKYAWTDGISASSIIYIEYSAELNGDAQIGDDGNDNTVILEYTTTDGGTDTRTEYKVTTYTYGLKILKTNTQGSTLGGVIFQLGTNNSTKWTDTDEYKYSLNNPYFVEEDDKNDKNNNIKFVQISDGIYRLATDEDTDTTYDLTTASDGTLYILGLDADTYYLKEVSALTGYVLPDDVWTVEIKDETIGKSLEGTIQYDSQDKDSLELLEATTLEYTLSNTNKSIPIGENGLLLTTIVNTSNNFLPSTGGMGTTIFYIVGGVLVVGAGVVLITKKRTKNQL